MRALLLLTCLVLIVAVLSRLPSALRARRPPPAAPRRDELVKDPVCQTYIPLSRAIRVEEDGTSRFFCSRECAARFARGERQE
jgi:YHS domain-containing protein